MSRDLKLFIRYITPSMAGMLIAGLYSIVDTFFIGKAVGAVGLAAAALTWPVVMLSGALGDMIGTGAAILLSQERGAGNHATANRAFCCMILAEIVVGALFAALLIPVLPAVLRGLGATPELFDGAYRYALILVSTSMLPMLAMGCIAVMRNDGQPVLAMWLVVVGLVSNIILDYLFIFPFGWGLAGAAAATAIAQSLTVVFGACYFRSGRTALRLTLAGLRPDWRILGICFRNGIPTLGAQLSIIGMLLMHNYQSLRYAAVAGLAAYSLIAAIESMGSMLMTGLAAGVQPLVSYFHGARKHECERCRHHAAFANVVLKQVVKHGVVLLCARHRMVQFKYQAGGALTVVIAFLIGNSEVNYFFFHFLYVYLYIISFFHCWCKGTPNT